MSVNVVAICANYFLSLITNYDRRRQTNRPKLLIIHLCFGRTINHCQATFRSLGTPVRRVPLQGCFAGNRPSKPSRAGYITGPCLRLHWCHRRIIMRIPQQMHAFCKQHDTRRTHKNHSLQSSYCYYFEFFKLSYNDAKY